MARRDDEGDFEIDELATSMGRRSPQASGQASWLQGDSLPLLFSVFDFATYTQRKVIARIESAEPKPVALQLHVSSAGGVFDHSLMASSLEAVGAGSVLIVEYGDLAGRHLLAADLRSGLYQLPASSFCQVYALLWNAAGTGAPFAIQAAGALSHALVPSPKYFTFTAAGDIAAAASAVTTIPSFTQFLDVWANGWANGIGGANAPILIAERVGLYRDYTTGLFVPPWGPVSYSGDGISTDTLTVENQGPATVRVFAQFYLQP